MKKKLLLFLFSVIYFTLFSQTTHQYDNLNRLIQTTYPDGTIETISYDAEGNRLSYTITGAAATVDLSFVSQSIASSTIAAGGNSVVNFTLENTGNTAAAGQKTYLYLSTDSDYDSGIDIELACQYVSGISSMGTVANMTNITIPSGTAAGSYYIVLVADGDQVVVESDENNNEANIPITISGTAPPNLVVSTASVSNTTIAAGTSTGINYSIANIEGAMVTGNTTFKCYLSTNLTYDGSDIELTSATATIAPLGGNASSNHVGTITIPSSLNAGSYYLIFYTDATDTEVETNDADNTASVAITVTSANNNAPIADFLGGSTSICIGQSIQYMDLSTNNPTAWSWTFAGGSPSASNAQNPTVTYNTPGTYDVTLTVSNASGTDVETKIGYITVGSGGGSAAPADWIWADQFTETGSADVRFADSYTTANDETYVLGHFDGTITIDGQTITSSHPFIEDIYIAKFNADGSLAWIQKHGLPDRQETYPAEIYVDDAGYIYITGKFYVQIDIGGTTIDSYYQSQPGQGGSRPDFYVAKLDPTGTSTTAPNTWLIHGENLSGANNSDGGVRLQVYQNEVFVVGRFDGDTRFGSTTLSFLGGNDVFLTAIDKNTGNFNWAKRIGGTDFESVLGFDIDANGKIYMGGFYRTDMSFDGTSTTLSAAGAPEPGYIVQYDAATGNFGWAKSINNGSQVYVEEIYSSGTAVYLTGTLINNDLSFAGSTIINNGWKDILVLKYDNSGNEIWGKNYGNTGEDNGYAITGDGTNIYLTGTHQDTVSFGTYTVTPSGNNTNLFLLGLDSSGNELWAESIEGSANIFGQRLNLTSTGNIVVGGTGAGGITFGNITTSGTYGPFIAEYMPSNTTPCIPFSTAITINGSPTICMGDEVQMVAESGYSYLWSTEATTQSIQANATGIYDVTVTNCNGCTAVSNGITISVSDDGIPTNASIVDENCNNSDGTMTFDMNNQQNVAVAWNGGNLTHAANSIALQIAGLSAGAYSITFTDDVGCAVIENVTIGSIGTNSVAMFSDTINDLTVNFTNTSTDATSYLWDFGDGTSGTTVANPSHTFSTYGTYNVCLTATNSCGSNVFCKNIVLEMANCFEVTNTNDSGNGSLRAAIDCANANVGADTIIFNIPTMDSILIQLVSELPILTDNSTVILAPTQPNFYIGQIELNGGQLSNAESGFTIDGDNIEIYGLYITDFPANGMYIHNANGSKIGEETTNHGNILSGNGKNTTLSNDQRTGLFIESSTNVLVRNNWIGTNKTGLSDHEDDVNNTRGILIYNCPDAYIEIKGGNVIAGNPNTGILARNSSVFNIQGNFIGTNWNNDASMNNGDFGIRLRDCNKVIIGGLLATERNIISNNGMDGIRIHDGSNNVSIQGNYIGTTVDGLAALQNNWNGINVKDLATSNITIGGNMTGAENLISGNDNNGILINSNAQNIMIESNKIGTNKDGLLAIPNSLHGINLTTIADTTYIINNLVSGNTAGSGIYLFESHHAIVQGNKLGTDITGTLPIPNLFHGVMIRNNSSDNTIGGFNPNEGNIIGFNAMDGIATAIGAVNNRFYRNSIFCNGQEGIDDDQGGSPANGNKPIPVITLADAQIITGTASADDVIELFKSDSNICMSANCQGYNFIGTTVADANGDWSLLGNFNTSVFITATATDANNTSEFSTCIEINDDNDGDGVLNIEDCHPNDPSDGILVINDTPLATGTYTAENKIESAALINNNADVDFKATLSVKMKPGFKAKAGSHFKAKIEDICAASSMPLEVSITATNVSCFGEMDGAAIANPINGDGNYSYLWNNGSNAANISSLTVGLYIVTVTDGMGQMAIDSVEIIEIFLDTDNDSITDGCDCDPNDPNDGITTIADNPLLNTVYVAPNQLTSSSIATIDSTVTFKATRKIQLLPGFKANLGSQFRAVIEDVCIPPAQNFWTDLNSTKSIEEEMLVSQKSKLNKDILFIPNPTSGKFRIESSGEIEQYFLYDSLGKLLLKGNNQLVDISMFANGIYFVRVSIGGKIIVGTIYKQS